MGVPAVNDEQNALIQYIKDHLIDWMEEKNVLPFPQSRNDMSPQLLERMVRVEEAIKLQNKKLELITTQMDKPFEEINRRFNRQGLYHLATFTAIVTSAVAILLNS